MNSDTVKSVRDTIARIVDDMFSQSLSEIKDYDDEVYFWVTSGHTMVRLKYIPSVDSVSGSKCIGHFDSAGSIRVKSHGSTESWLDVSIPGTDDSATNIAYWQVLIGAVQSGNESVISLLSYKLLLLSTLEECINQYPLTAVCKFVKTASVGDTLIIIPGACEFVLVAIAEVNSALCFMLRSAKSNEMVYIDQDGNSLDHLSEEKAKLVIAYNKDYSTFTSDGITELDKFKLDPEFMNAVIRVWKDLVSEIYTGHRISYTVYSCNGRGSFDSGFVAGMEVNINARLDGYNRVDLDIIVLYTEISNEHSITVKVGLMPLENFKKLDTSGWHLTGTGVGLPDNAMPLNELGLYNTRVLYEYECKDYTHVMYDKPFKHMLEMALRAPLLAFMKDCWV